jgi:hypothetical protein
MKKWSILLIIITSIFYQANGQNIILEKDIISNAATSSGNNEFKLTATLGQPIIGITQNTNIVSSQGFWYVASDFTNGSTNTTDLPDGILELTVVPNPTSYQGTLTFVATESMTIKIDILNNIGQNTSFHFTEEVIEGKNIIPLDVSNLLPGQYFINLTAQNKTYTKKIVIVK